jgi:hypothetical protein
MYNIAQRNQAFAFFQLFLGFVYGVGYAKAKARLAIDFDGNPLSGIDQVIIYFVGRQGQ